MAKRKRKRKTLSERVLKTVPVYGDRFQLEHLRDWDKEARLLIQKELENSLDYLKPMLQSAVEEGDHKLVKRIEGVRRNLHATEELIRTSPAPYSATYTAMKTVGEEEIKSVIDLDEDVYGISQDICALAEEAGDAFPGDRGKALSIAESTAARTREIRKIYTKRHVTITRPKERGVPPY